MKKIIFIAYLQHVLLLAPIVFLFSDCSKKDEVARVQGGAGSGSGTGSGTGTGSGSNLKKPLANAGPDQEITLPEYTATLDGTRSVDSTPGSSQIFWKLLSPGSNALFVSQPNTIQVKVAFSEPGTYSFELQISNTAGTSKDTTTVVVKDFPYCGPPRPEVKASLNFLCSVPYDSYDSKITVANDKLIIPAEWNNITGSSLNGISELVNIYDIPTNSWTALKLSSARVNIAIAVTVDKYIFAGGVSYDPNWNVVPSNIIDIYDLPSRSWSTAKLSEARGMIKTALIGNKILFAGGLRENGVLSNTVDIYDIESKTWSATKLKGEPRAIIDVVTTNDKAFFIGGYTKWENPTGFGEVFTKPTTTIDIYDENSMQWSKDEMQTNRGYFSTSVIGDEIIIAGGEWSMFPISTLSRDVEVFNFKSGSRSNMCLYQRGLFSNPGIKRDNLIVFLPSYIKEQNKFDIFNTTNRTWQVGVLPPGSLNEIGEVSIVSAKQEIFVKFKGKLYKLNF